ncbi:MAG: Ferric transporter ATP-binding subunit [Rhizobacter sp.]|nr:Ferric transporter ATP-binding subunit [Rhizobacter sp.]
MIAFIKTFAVAAVIGGFAGTSVSALAAAPVANWDAVVAAAKKEGKVVVYSSTFGSLPYKAVTKAFEAAYGIPVETLDIRASEMYERVRVELGAQRYIGDVVIQPRSVVTVIERGHLLQPHLGIPNIANLRSGVQATNVSVPIYTALYGILVNGKVSAADEPKSWKDLLDPKWKGKLILDDPRAIGNGFSFFNATYKGLGADYQRSLSQQAPVISRQVRNDERRVARGEFPLYAPHNFTFFNEMKGLPVRFVFPSEGSPNADQQAVIIKNAPHLNAARLFINYMLDTQAQTIYANSGVLPVSNGIAEKANVEVKQMFAVKLLPQVSVDDMDSLMDVAKGLYK